MAKPSRGLDLAEEPLRAEIRGEVGTQDLERHLAVMPQVDGEIDRSHAAFTELTLDAIAVGGRRD